jgi:hypothetical protein
MRRFNAIPVVSNSYSKLLLYKRHCDNSMFASAAIAQQPQARHVEPPAGSALKNEQMVKQQLRQLKKPIFVF